MKIYAADRNRSNEAILDSIIGVDKWILVHDQYFDRDYYMQFLSKHESCLGFTEYLCHSYRAEYLQPRYADRNDLTESLEIIKYRRLDNLTIIKPIIIYTTDELYALIDEAEAQKE